VITLRGVVPDDAARSKAVTLAAETVGVNRVINQLTVLRPSEESDQAPARRQRANRAANPDNRDKDPDR